jgi:hypothetical protein
MKKEEFYRKVKLTLKDKGKEAIAAPLEAPK